MKKLIKERFILAVAVTVLAYLASVSAYPASVSAVAVTVSIVFISCDGFRRYFRRPSNEVGKTGFGAGAVYLGG